MRNINNGLNGLNGYYFQGVHLSQVHQPRSVPTKKCTNQEVYQPRSVPTKKCTNQARERIKRIYCCLGRINNGFIGLNGFVGCVNNRIERILFSGGALVSSAPTELRWCTSCYVGALETSAPPEVSSICVNPCNLWENISSRRFCFLC